ncbi:MAG TPA: PDZ domain-containing protein [Smithellaceae bacterium]|jgi:general secretion pathway protein C|nr:PDZ domain-containing protein [Smithellaceae bacterium]
MRERMLAKIEQIFNKWKDKARDFLSESSLDSAKLRIAAVFVAITVLSYQGVSLFYKIFSFMMIDKSTVAAEEIVPTQVVRTAMKESLPDYGVITERNIFQTTLKETSDQRGGFFVQGEEIAEFDLKGTIAGTDSFGFIIIEERNSKKQRLYRIGDMIGTARVVSISRNTATINREGRDITLKIKHTPEAPLLSRSAREKIRSSQISVEKKEVTKRLEDLKIAMNDAQVRSYFVGGAQQGYIISNIKPNSIYQKLGLQNGDIIIDVNNKRMQNIDDLLELVNLMQAGQNIVLNLKRNGKDERINYSFQ